MSSHHLTTAVCSYTSLDHLVKIYPNTQEFHYNGTSVLAFGRLMGSHILSQHQPNRSRGDNIIMSSHHLTTAVCSYISLDHLVKIFPNTQEFHCNGTSVLAFGRLMGSHILLQHQPNRSRGDNIIMSSHHLTSV